MQLHNQINLLFWKTVLKARRKRIYYIYRNQYRRYMKLMFKNDANKKAEGEDDYVEVWNKFGVPVEPYSYRYFSQYLGPNPYIIPEDIGHSFIGYHLNPVKYRDFYSDKNTYNFLFDTRITMPQTIFRKIDGGKIMNDKYEVVDSEYKFEKLEFDCLVLKPTVDSNSGNSVLVFTKYGNGYISKQANKDITLTFDYLNRYGTDWILQEGVRQHQTISFFNRSSVNTLRLCTYRSVVNDTIHVSSAALRIGKTNSQVDNLHAGGVMVKINLDDGSVDNKVFDQYGRSFPEWNDINFNTIDVNIPSWNKVIEFAKLVAGYYKHSRLLALDISINQEGEPVLIEVNNIDFSFWIPMLLGYDVFCGETEDVIEYCLKKEREMKSYKIRLV